MGKIEYLRIEGKEIVAFSCGMQTFHSSLYIIDCAREDVTGRYNNGSVTVQLDSETYRRIVSEDDPEKAFLDAQREFLRGILPEFPEQKLVRA